jgi:2-dehydro-3-deoxygluconokinase
MSSPQRVALVGECMIELQEESAGLLRRTFGGDTLNTAVYLSRLLQGHAVEVNYVTALGDDPHSEAMLAAWQAEGIKTGLVQQLQGRVPGLYMIQVDPTGERHFSYWRDTSAAKAYFETSATPLEAALNTIDVLYFSGISLAILPEAGKERLLQTAATLRARGGKVIFDNNYRPRLWRNAEEARHWYERAYTNCDTALITLDDDIAMAAQPVTTEQALAAALALPVAEVVVKQGGNDTVVRLAGQPPQSIKPTRVDKVVDTTAAGDSFGAGYVAARLTGHSPAEAAATGNALAGTVIQHRGAIIATNAMPNIKL